MDGMIRKSPPSEDMKEIPNLARMEGNTARGQGTGLPPAACTRASQGEHLGGVQIFNGVAASDQEYLGVPHGVAATCVGDAGVEEWRQLPGGDLLAGTQAAVLGH